MRVLLKISGEALKGKQNFGIDVESVKEVTKSIIEISKLGHELAIVVGGGNIYRGSNLIESGVNPADSHNLSMLSTIFNGVVLKNFLEKSGIKAIVMDALSIDFLEKFNKDKAKTYLQKGNIVIFTGGTGNPYFTTDTGGVLRALEVEADMMIKATKVKGVYDKDPVKYIDARFISNITYDEIITKNLVVMDISSVVMAKDNNLVLKVVSLYEKGAILDTILGKEVGTTIS